MDLYGVGQCEIGAYSYMPLAVVPSSTVWPSLNITYGNSTYYPGYTYGLRMPLSAITPKPTST